MVIVRTDYSIHIICANLERRTYLGCPQCAALVAVFCVVVEGDIIVACAIEMRFIITFITHAIVDIIHAYAWNDKRHNCDGDFDRVRVAQEHNIDAAICVICYFARDICAQFTGPAVECEVGC